MHKLGKMGGELLAVSMMIEAGINPDKMSNKIKEIAHRLIDTLHQTLPKEDTHEDFGSKIS